MASASTARSIASSCKRALGLWLLAGLLSGPAAAQPWSPVRGQAADVAVSADGPVYAAGIDGALWRWIDGTPEWTPFPGRATRLAAGPAGTLWAVSQGVAARFDGTRWVRMDRRARDVGVDAAGNAYVVLEDGGLARWDARSRGWQALPGRGARIAAGPAGVAWLVKEDQSIARLEGENWREVPGRARDIAVSPEGTAFIAALDGTLQRWDGASWATEPGVAGAAIVAAGRGSVPWVANEAGAIITRAPVKPGQLELSGTAQAQTPEGINFQRSGRRSARAAA